MPRVDFNVIEFLGAGGTATVPLPDREDLIDGTFSGTGSKLLYMHTNVGSTVPEALGSEPNFISLSGKAFLLDTDPTTGQGASLWFKKDNVNNQSDHMAILIRANMTATTISGYWFIYGFSNNNPYVTLYRIDNNVSRLIYKEQASVSAADTGFGTNEAQQIKILTYDTADNETICQLFVWNKTTSEWSLEFDGIDTTVDTLGRLPAGVPGFMYSNHFYSGIGIKVDDFKAYNVNVGA